MAPASGTLAKYVVMNACALAAMDGALLPASFAALSEQLQVGTAELGLLNFSQSIACSLALPVWGWLLQLTCGRNLLACGCMMWGAATFLLAMSSNLWVHLMLRLVVGVSLAVVTPIGQAMICELYPESGRGRAFGWLQSASTLMSAAVTFATTCWARKNICGVSGWRVINVLVAALSWGMAAAIRWVVPVSLVAPSPGRRATLGDMRARITNLVCKKPSFLLLLGQGVTAGIPWNAFAFLPLYFQLSGFPDLSAGEIVSIGGLGGVIGGVVGGWLGDWAHRRWPYAGRCGVAQLSLFLGATVFVAVMKCSPRFWAVVSLLFLFNVVACWTPVAALRPICGDIVRDSQDRAQMMATWICLEGIITSTLGAPLVGLLSEGFGCRLTSAKAHGEQTAAALRAALLGVALVPWLLSWLVWLPMLGIFNENDSQTLEPAEFMQMMSSFYYGIAGAFALLEEWLSSWFPRRRRQADAES
ncbi:baiG [Symbiodinium sp. CCMP2592]|nr:baiG [Symbiodinium sp. CCMP2592]